MRKILSQEELAAKQKTRNIIISIVLLGIMLFSVAGFAFFYQSNSSTGAGTTNSSEVQNIGNEWEAIYQNSSLIFSDPPDVMNETAGINNIFVNVNLYYGKPLYIDTDSNDVYNEIGYNLGQYVLRVQHGCYSNCSNSTYPQKGCNNNIIVYTPSFTNSISQNSSCIFINGDMRAVDAFLYKTFGIN